MREVNVSSIITAVRDMCIRANRYLPDDVTRQIEAAFHREETPVAKEVLRQLQENIDLAADTGLPLCQDCGLAVIFVKIGQDVRIVGGSLAKAIHEGVRQGYRDGYLRKSVCHPFTRVNTQDNTPAFIHYEIVPGDKLTLFFMAKGGGAENMSRVTMLAPAEGWEGVKGFIIERVAESRANPCPPIIVGVGIGGTFDYSAVLAKKALLRRLEDCHPDPDIASKEKELFEAINQLNIGPMGLGGKTTCLGVKMLVEPCHIASLPVAVNIQCHSSRHEEVEL